MPENELINQPFRRRTMGALEELTEKVLQQHEQMVQAKRRVSIALDSDTVEILKTWNVGNYSETVAHLCRVAAAHLTTAKAKRDEVAKPARADDKKALNERA